MAPVKAVARATRSTRAATVAKQNTTTASKKAEAPATRKPATSKTTKTAPATRRTRAKPDEPESDEEDELQQTEQEVVEKPATRSGRTTKAAAKPATTSLSSAPRRRVKVTPLDSQDSVPQEEEKPKRSKTTTTTTTKKGATKAGKSTPKSTSTEEPSQNAVDELMEDQDVATTTRSAHTKSTVSSTAKSAPKAQTTGATRGRSKKTAAEPTANEVQHDVKPVRATRSNRAGSVTSSVAPETEAPVEPAKPKSTAASRKKVTFQDIPEDDKENQPLPTKGKKSVTAKKPASKETSATGVKAKPLRKPATTTASSTRAQKATTATKASKKTDKSEEKSIPRALTPKKITQVARAATPEDEHERSDSEDELNHAAKTPVRDLSLSPRRPPTSATANALVQSMSPSKKLGPTPSFATSSPGKSNPIDHNGALASPARRLPASPSRDSVRESPKRGLGNAGRLLFSPSKNGEQDNTTSTSQHGNGVDSHKLMQSPKRSAILDPELLFPQSAVKSKSPFKASLLASPAKRSVLLSSSKAKSSGTSPGKENAGPLDINDMDVTGLVNVDTEEEVSASSHQRAVASPLRVHRMSDDELQMDFDESVLPIGSPFKLAKSPRKDAPATVFEGDEELDVSSEAGYTEKPERSMSWEQGASIEPNKLMSQNLPEHFDDTDNTSISETDEEDHNLHQSPLVSASSKSPVVKKYRDEEVTSEDELAGDDTPDRSFRPKSSRPSVMGKIRQSTGISSMDAGSGFGFTPLAAQVEGWKASSPNKQAPERRVSAAFSPLARGHIDGEVVVSRDNTPIQKLKLSNRASAVRSSTPRSSVLKHRQSVGLRKSMAQRDPLSMHLESANVDVADQNALFQEQMEVRAEEEEINEHNQATEDLAETDSADDKDFEDIMQMDAPELTSASEDGDDTVLVHELNGDDTIEPSQTEPAELTTDLINFTNASDTAIVDFQKLAEEANHLASDDVTAPSEDSGMVDEVEIPESVTEELGDASNGTGLDEASSPAHASHVTSGVGDSPVSLREHELTQMGSPPGFHVEEAHVIPVDDNATPIVQRPISRNFNVNTVVSKVPLRPEGEESPLKLPKKRALSFGASNDSARSAKRVSFGWLPDLNTKVTKVPSVNGAEPEADLNEDDEILEAERRMSRTSVAPSPGGTSTPATIKSMRSLGGMSAATTPRRISFGVSDFGDSTLDGIELPSDYEDGIELENEATVEIAAGELTEIGGGLESAVPTPMADESIKTPATFMSTRLAAEVNTPATSKTPVPAKARTPATTRKTPAKTSGMANAQGRTPLKPVSDGALSAATVFVDVRTSEGADASGVFVSLLTELGARCVREWRWNSRASLAAADLEEQITAGPGITHVVFKDGSPKTLERVRHAAASNFNVFCVGVGWVLDCEKEGKWIDETNYLVDKSVMAKGLANSSSGSKGGSKRRKSMEPSMLVADGFGSVKRSVSKARRSVSAEMLEGARKDLREIATPRASSTSIQIGQSERHQDSENVAPSPAASDDAGSPPGAATPTGYVSYDPSTSMTPGPMTPYLVSEGKKLVQMSAPPKQQRLSIFEDPNASNGEKEDDNGTERSSKKYKLSKGNVDKEKRRQTLGVGLGFKPIVGSPLGREFR